MTPITGSIVVGAPLALVFRLLSEPREQARWNSLYEAIDSVSDVPVRDGSTFGGRFKGSGRATVRFERVRPDVDFIHRATVAIAGRVVLGEMRHTYAVEEASGGTRVTQTVEFKPSGLGKLLAGTLRRAFAKRLPESFAEFRTFLKTLSETER